MGSHFGWRVSSPKNWQALDETRSRAADPIFVDIAAQALGGNSSYSTQLLRGATTGGRFSTARAASTSTGTTASLSATSTVTDSTIFTFASQPAFPTGSIETAGDGTFEDITEASGVGILENTACALFADFDNDGRQDLIVVRTNGPLLFLNQGGGKFRQKARRVSICQSSARDFHRSGRRRLRPRRLVGHLLLPLHLLPGHGPVQISFSLLRRGKRPAQFHDAQQPGRNFPRCHRGVGPRPEQYSL